MGGQPATGSRRDVAPFEAAAVGASVGPVDVPEQVQSLATAFAAGADVRTTASQELVGLRTLIDQLEAVWLTAAAEFQRSGGPEQEGAGSMAAWLRRDAGWLRGRQPLVCEWRRP